MLLMRCAMQRGIEIKYESQSICIYYNVSACVCVRVRVCSNATTYRLCVRVCGCAVCCRIIYILYHLFVFSAEKSKVLIFE